MSRYILLLITGIGLISLTWPARAADPGYVKALPPVYSHGIYLPPLNTGTIPGFSVGNFRGGGGGGAGSSQTANNNSDTANSKNDKHPCPDGQLDPVMMHDGNKIESSVDFSMPGEMGIKFERFYISRHLHGSTIYGGWTDGLDYELHTLCSPGEPSTCSQATFIRPDGSELTFSQDGAAQAGQNLHGAFTEIGGGGLATLSYYNSGDGLPGVYTLVDEDSTVYTWDENRGLASIKDAAGVGWNIFHGLNTNVTTVRHTSGQIMKLVTTTEGSLSVLTVTDPAGNNYVYKSADNSLSGISYSLIPMDLATVILPGSPSTTISYKYTTINGNNPAISEVDYNGVAHDLTYYDSTGRAYKTSMADGTQTASIAYGSNLAGPTATLTNPLGHVTVFQYNSGAQLLSASGQASALCAAYFNSVTYDSNGNLQSSTDNKGYVTGYTYAATGQLTKKMDGGVVGPGPMHTISYSRITDYVWDPTPGTDRMLSVTVEGWSRTTFTYNAQGRLASSAITNLSPSGTANQTLTTSYGYVLYANGMVQTLSVVHPSPGGSDTDVYAYDALGNLTSAANGLGQTTRYTGYNALGEPGSITGPNGDVTNYSYDARGRIASIVRYPNGVAATWSTTYDGFGLPASTTAPDGATVVWSRNPYMQVTSITRNDKDGSSTESFVYDANGDVTTHTLARGSDIGIKTTATYDALGRLYQQQGMHGQSLTYAYDTNDNLVSVTDALGHATAWQYDALDRVTQTTDANGGITKYTYDLADDVVTVTDPRGLVTAYAYDGLGLLWGQSSPDTGTTTFAYDVYGRRTSMTRANGVTTSYGYDTLGRRTSLSAGGQTQAFSYDSCTHGIGRLCAASDTTGTTSYAYTPEGWISTRSFSIGGTSYALGYGYDNDAHLASVTYPDGN